MHMVPDDLQPVAPAWRSQASGILERAAPVATWLVFLALLLWGWRARDLFHAIPAYGDALEVAWVTEWYSTALKTGALPAVYPLVFYPAGWHVATYAGGPVMFALLVPLNWLAGTAFAYNAVTILSFVLAFAGSVRLARRFLSPLAAAVAGLAFTFWGLRWYSIIGQTNILLGTALLPWLLLCLDHGVQTRRSAAAGRWYALAGLAWALSLASSLYFLWIAGVAVLAWAVGSIITRRDVPGLLRGLAITSAVAAIASAPWLYVFWRASQAAGAPFYNLDEVNSLGTSLNDLAIPYVFHPFLGQWAQRIYLGPLTEQAQANLGAFTWVAALFGAAHAWRRPRWRPVLVAALAGLLLSLGPTLKWNDEPLTWAGLRWLDQALWALGHALKPGLFPGSAAPAPFATAVPLPGLLLSAIVPFWERARVAARFAFVAALGLFLLAAFALDRLHRPWLRLLCAALLVFEIVPPPSASLAFPGASHPAFTWLRAHPLGGAAIADLFAPDASKLDMYMRSETLWATRYHRQPTLGGASSVWPAPTLYLVDWLTGHPHPFTDSAFVPLLRAYNVRIIALHMKSDNERGMLQEAKRNPAVGPSRCFDPDPAEGPWTYPICLLEILPGQ